jgi:hypothetical protein
VYFILLVALGCAALLAPVLYNRSIQLRPEQLAEARQRWGENGSRDYDLDYRIKHGTDPRPDVYHVEVRGGAATRILCNGQALLLADPSAGLGIGLAAGVFHDDDAPRQTVDGIFEHLHGLLAHTQDRAAPGRDYCVARFDAATGYPIHIIHRAAGTHQRQEWAIRVTPR